MTCHEITKLSKLDGLLLVKSIEQITKVFNHYEIPQSFSGTIRNAFKCKLYRMGQLLHKCGGSKRQSSNIKPITLGEVAISYCNIDLLTLFFCCANTFF